MRLSMAIGQPSPPIYQFSIAPHFTQKTRLFFLRTPPAARPFTCPSMPVPGRVPVCSFNRLSVRVRQLARPCVRRPLPEISFGCLRSIQRAQPRINLLCGQELLRAATPIEWETRRGAMRKGNTAHGGVRLISLSRVGISQKEDPEGRIRA